MSAPLLRADALAAGERSLRALEIALRRRVPGVLQGDRSGVGPGPGGDLDAAREYRPGQDDVRRMDWSVSARTGVAHVRTTLAERELETWVLVDGSASMDFGTALLEKRDLAVAVLAAVGALTGRPGNRLGACVASGGAWRTHRPRGGRAGTRLLVRAVAAAPRAEPGPDAAVDLAAGLERLRREHRRPGLRVVVSDFLDPVLDDPRSGPAAGPPPWAAPLRRLARRHDVVAVEVVDPRELALPDVGLVTLVDPETGRRREVRTDDRRLRARYAAAATAHRAGTAAAVRAAGAAHLVLRTDGDWVTDVARFATARRSSARRGTAHANTAHRAAAPVPRSTS